MARKFLILLLIQFLPLWGGVLSAAAQNIDVSVDPFVPSFSELAPGVWVGVRENNLRIPVMGTTTFVISEEGVVVFDGGGAPTFGERVIEKIKSLTDLPVTHLIISHWHGDHAFGLAQYLKEFPNVHVISHTFTRRVLLSSRSNYVHQEDNYFDTFMANWKESLDKGQDIYGNASQAWQFEEYQSFLNHRDIISHQYAVRSITPPNLTFDDKLVIHSGSRTIELLYLGDGNTAGDISMWLPEERIVSTGDTVVHPVQYAFNMPPQRWSNTLRNINALDYAILVPGHGDVQYNKNYVNLLIEVADSAIEQRDQLITEGLTDEQITEGIDLSSFAERLVGDNEFMNYYLKGYFFDPLAAAALLELKGEPMVTIPEDE